MIVQCRYVDESFDLKPLDPLEAFNKSSEDGTTVWLDLLYSETAQLEEWLDRVETSSLTRRICLEGLDRAGFYPLKNELLLVIPVLLDTGDQEDPYVVEYVAFLCRGNLLFSIHKNKIFDRRRFASMQEHADWLPERTVPSLLSAVLMGFSMDGLRHASVLRSSVIGLEDRMDRDPDDVEVEEIMDVRAELLPLASVVADQLPPIEALNSTERAFFRFGDARDFMTCALVNLKAADVSLEWLDQRIGALRSGFQMNSQDKTNRRLGMLTILSAIFMPITLMAGIWGMNFEYMPEFKHTFGYPLALGVMAVIGGSMFLFFRRNGWFD